MSVVEARDLLALIPDADLIAEYKRRGLEKPAGTALTVYGLTVDPLIRTARWRGRTVALSYREAEVLYALALYRWQGVRAVPIGRLAAKVWRIDDEDSRNVLHQYLSRLRRKLPGLIDNPQPRSKGGVYGLALDAQAAA